AGWDRGRGRAGRARRRGRGPSARRGRGPAVRRRMVRAPSVLPGRVLTLRGDGLDAVASPTRGSFVLPPIRTFTVGPGVPPGQPLARTVTSGSRTVTAGSDFHRPRSTIYSLSSMPPWTSRVTLLGRGVRHVVGAGPSVRECQRDGGASERLGAGERAQRRNLGGDVRRAVDRRTGDEHVGARLGGASDRVARDAAVDLDPHVEVARGEQG